MTTIKDILYEPPGPKTRRMVAICTTISLAALAALAAVVIRQFYLTGQLDARYWAFFGRLTTWKFMAHGLAGTMKAAVTAGCMSFAMGFLMMIGRFSKRSFIRGLSATLVEFSRGVPTLLFVYFFFLVAPQLGISLPAFWKISTPVAISAAGIVSEVLRSGVNAVPKGQREAAMSIGMRDGQVFMKIIFPQALRIVVPALISELVIVLKDTTFAYVVNYADLMQNAKVLISNYDALLSVYLVVAIIYILINFVLNQVSVALARRGTTPGAPAKARA